MKQPTTIAVLGGGGKTGTYLVQELLHRGYQLKLLLRQPDTLSISSPSIYICKGDAIHYEDIRALVRGCDAIISTVGQRPNEPLVASQVTNHLLRVMDEFQIRRYISVAGLNLDTPTDQKSARTQMATDWMKATYPTIHEDRQKAYKVLAQNPVDWTLVRVPFIEFTDSSGATEVDLVDCPGEKVRATDLASFLADQLTDTRYYRQSPFVASL
ncbi:NAD(P)-dependent oxidoreductase [Telluribacter sp. SYSU D00476]|uniref:NAD(P)-dependent oxidoreductase n=1 Tax=Telluribacter sp. SYSU D00476 TaxID=2811430 RepID=UPI001FF1EA9D|nr:NAD(P)H-binding protein [Telluribacter sp. SYSU D00476]